MVFNQHNCPIDGQGRLRLPAKLRKEFGEEAVLIWVKDHAEIWDEKKWEKEKIQLGKILEEVIR